LAATSSFRQASRLTGVLAEEGALRATSLPDRAARVHAEKRRKKEACGLTMAGLTILVNGPACLWAKPLTSSGALASNSVCLEELLSPEDPGLPLCEGETCMRPSLPGGTTLGFLKGLPISVQS
jgi:hypothetical protein